MKTTVVIVSYKSDHLIEKNIEKFDNQTRIIVIDNSQNINLKNNLEHKYKKSLHALFSKSNKVLFLFIFLQKNLSKITSDINFLFLFTKLRFKLFSRINTHVLLFLLKPNLLS